MKNNNKIARLLLIYAKYIPKTEIISICTLYIEMQM